MRHSFVMFAVAAFALLSPSAADAVEPHFEVGLGLPELARVRAGVLVHPRLSVEAYAAAVLLQPVVGLGATGYFLGEPRDDRPPRHALGAQATLGTNPTLRPLQIESGGETVASTTILQGGYAYTADSGFLFRAWLGALLLWENGLSGGPSLSIGAGWIF